MFLTSLRPSVDLLELAARPGRERKKWELTASCLALRINDQLGSDRLDRSYGRVETAIMTAMQCGKAQSKGPSDLGGRLMLT